MRMFDGYIFDLDGTIYWSDRLVPGADETIRRLREMGRKVMFLSNKPLNTIYEYAEKLTRLGIPTRPEEVVNSSYILAEYLRRMAPDALVYPIGEAALVSDLERAGIRYTLEPDKVNYEVDYVVTSFDRTFNYDKLNHALQAVIKGAKVIATNADRTCPVDGGVVPDGAGMIGAIEAVIGRKIDLVVGKPNPLIAEYCLEKMGLSPERCLMVGDSLESDIATGKNAGMATCLVMTGIVTAKALAASEIRPDYVLDSVAELVDGIA